MRITRFWVPAGSISTTGRKRWRRSKAGRRKRIFNLAAEAIAEAAGGRLISGDPRRLAAGVSTDSRTIRAGELFVPLKGPNFDGHRFVAAALQRGACGALLEPGEEGAAASFPGPFFIRVPDALKALGDLAHFWRNKHRVQVAAITGSNGKTTTKEMTARILERRFRVLRNEGNLNNLIGLPLSLLKLTEEHEIAVLEMGMNLPGEIRRLKAIADPRISLITNVGRAHLEFLGSLEGVARAKGELWEELRVEDWIGVNADDERVVRLAASAPCRKKSFGIEKTAEIRAEGIGLDEGRGVRFDLCASGRKVRVSLTVFGRHNVYNALAAASLAEILGLGPEEIAAGLEAFQPLYSRGKPVLLPGGVHVLDDSYNSNPDSLRATLAAFAEMKGENRGLAVLGDMLEVGPSSPEFHEQAGREIGGMGLAHLIVFGEASRGIAAGAREAGMEENRVHEPRDVEELVAVLEGAVRAGDWILIKGSRRMRMERVVEALKTGPGRA
jgi:UDP-N-acetylmuramoyl-tripeptide--D-alanyl-D-alanine ligase